MSKSELREKMPLAGLRLLRWRLALAFYRLGCRISGRHEYLLVWEEDWKEHFCPHCGWIPDIDIQLQAVTRLRQVGGMVSRMEGPQ
jgi:hypothetical protein